jgi:hypothetical protein
MPRLSFVLLSGLLPLLIGCGSISNSTTPSRSAAPDAYLATVFVNAGMFQLESGQVTVDNTANNGAGNLQLTNVGSAVSSSLVLQFCVPPSPAFGFAGCFDVTSFTTDAKGNASVSFSFPRKGTFTGIFQLLSNGGEIAVTATGTTGTNFRSALLPAASITGGIGQTTGAATGSGSVVVTGTTAHMTLSSTTPNHAFDTAVCVALSGPCTGLATVTTDAQGNASADIGSVQPGGWSLFSVSDSAGVEFVSAFRVQ